MPNAAQASYPDQVPRRVGTFIPKDGESPREAQTAHRHDEAVGIERLTARQREVLALLAKGLSNKQIGAALEISSATARTHVTDVLNALEVGNRTEAAAAYVAFSAQPAQVESVLARPAITVLPFQALDEDPTSRQLALGLGSDLLNLFARWCWFPAVHSGYSARNLPSETPSQIGRALGVRFVVCGDVRLRRGTLRIQAWVEDVHTQSCLWAERYDIAEGELFAVEDLVSTETVAKVYSVLTARMRVQDGRPAESALAPWMLAHEGMLLRELREAKSNDEACARFQAALQREPDLVMAHFGLGLASYDRVLNQFGSPTESLERMAACAERCIKLAPHAAEGYYLNGRYHQARGELTLSARMLTEAIGHNPSFGAAHALLAQVLVLSGQLDPGLQRMLHAVRLGPRSFVSGLSVVHFARLEYAEGLHAAEKALSINSAYPFARGIAAACAFFLGRTDDAQAHFRELCRIAPTFAPSVFRRHFGADVDAVDRLARALDVLRSGRSLPQVKHGV